MLSKTYLLIILTNEDKFSNARRPDLSRGGGCEFNSFDKFVKTL